MAAKSWIGWSLALAGALVTGPLVLGLGNPAWTPARDQIASLSEVERAVLDRKYRQYQALTEGERTVLRTLHQQIEADRAHGARHQTTLDGYCDWLKTIDAWQQDELANIESPAEKTQRVREIVTERQEKALAAAADEGGLLPYGLGRFPSLSEDQLTKVFDVLAKRLRNLSEVDQKDIESQRGLKRFGIQAKLLKQQFPNLERIFQFVSESEVKEMIEASGNTDLIALASQTGDAPGPGRKNLARRGITVSIGKQFMRESAQATDAELQTYFGSLSNEDQDQLLQFRADDFKIQLRLRFLSQDPDIAELKHLLGDDLFNSFLKFEWIRNQGGFPNPNGPGGGQFARPGSQRGEGPPIEGRGEGNRGGPFRPLNDRSGPGRDGPPRRGEAGGPGGGPEGERPFAPGNRPPRDSTEPPSPRPQ